MVVTILSIQYEKVNYNYIMNYSNSKIQLIKNTYY